MSATMLPVEKKIYQSRNVVKGSYYHQVITKDLISVIHSPLVGAGYHLGYDGVYRRLGIAVGVETPWHHVKHLRTKKCLIDHNVKFNLFNYVPPRCLECWKVVVAPRTLKELFLLLEVEKGLNHPSKCGIELRYYTPRLYGGYFYNNSLDEGRATYERVRKAVSDHVSPEAPVILKRACTEYEMILGPSVMWHMTPKQHEIDTRLDSIIDITTPNTTGQNDECIAQVHSHWIEWAWKHGDKTVDEYLGGERLYPATMTYHDGDLNEIKMDMMRAKALVKHGIDGEVVDTIHAALRGFQMTRRVGVPELGAVLGFESINPLFAGEFT